MGMGFPMGMGRNGKQPVWEWEWLLFPWESIPIADAVLGLCNSVVYCISLIVIIVSVKFEYVTDGRTSPASCVCNKLDAGTSCVSNKLINSALVNSLNMDTAMLPDTNDFCLIAKLELIQCSIL